MQRALTGHTWALALSVGVGVLVASESHARPTGEPQACSNCHEKNGGPVIDVKLSNEHPAPGETVTLTVGLTALAPDALRTGLYVTTVGGVGEFLVLEPNGMRLATPTQIVHSQPKDLVDKKAQFELAWKAPSAAGVAQFNVWSITGNTNGTPADDHYATVAPQIAFGCDAVYYYPDQDKDGFGDLKKGKLSCSPVANLIVQGGDCNDADKLVSPSATELCNVVDDNCNGMLDDGLTCGLVYPDADGDGAGARAAAPVYGAAGQGFSATMDDCNDADASLFPKAPEVANGRDDNCNGQVDEVTPALAPTGSGAMAGAPSTTPVVAGAPREGAVDRAGSGGASCSAGPARQRSSHAGWLALAFGARRLTRRRVDAS